MSGTAFTVGAEFVLSDKASPEIRRLIEMAERFDKLLLETQGKLDKLGLGGAVEKIKGEWEEISRITTGGVDSVLKSMAGMGTEGSKAFASMVKGAGGAFDEILTSSVKMQGNVLEEMEALSKGSVEALRGIGAAAPAIFDPLVSAARASGAEVEAIMGRVTGSVEGSVARLNAAGAASAVRTASGGSAIATLEEHASLGTRKAAAHGVHGAHASGLHFGGLGTHVGGSHASLGGDGIVPAVAGYGMLEVLKHATEGAMEFRHWEEMFKSSSFSDAEVKKAEKASWANAMKNPNVSATDSLKSLFEMIKVFPKAGEQGPSVDEAVDMLPAVSQVMVGLQSVKAESLHSKFAEGRQVYDLAKGLEETGVTQRGATAEIRETNTKHMMNELFKTMLSERGVTDGSQFYAMTNNAKGAAQNWDERMATVVAPILGSVMKHSRLGNADYMALKTFQAGRADSKTIQGLANSGLIDEDIASGKAWTDTKHQWHLEANNAFSQGLDKNVWDWSGRKLDVLKAHGVDTNDQEKVNAVINSIGANASTTTIMRALAAPVSGIR